MSDDLITPPEARFGWAGLDEAERAFEKLQNYFVDFVFENKIKSTNGVVARLFDFEKAGNNGHFFPCFRQLVGSCVGQGLARATWTLTAIEKFRNGEEHEACTMPYEPYGYGASRVYQLGWTRGEGSTGAAAAAAAQEDGQLPSDIPGLPAWQESKDSAGRILTITWPAEVDNKWGNSKATLDKWRPMAVQHVVKSAARLRNYDQVRDALANFYPITVASDAGFVGNPYEKYGKMWIKRKGVWQHQMCWLAVDDDPRQPGVWNQNSWGHSAHGKNLPDTPGGGFWITADDVDYMCKNGEVYALSGLNGFKEQRELSHLLL